MVRSGAPVTVRGIAFDGGSGIRTVEVSTDDGATWTPAALGQDLGPYAFRPWSLTAALALRAPAIRVVRHAVAKRPRARERYLGSQIA